MRIKLKDFLQEISEKTTESNQYPVLTSSKNGLFLQRDYFKKSVASIDNTGYKIIREGQFTYRAMSDTGQFFPNRLECVDIGVVSPAYPVFKIYKNDWVLGEYLKYYFKSDIFQQSISLMATGSTRTSVKFTKIKEIDINLPDICEQKKQTEVLDKVFSIIENRKRQLIEFDEFIKSRFVEVFGDPNLNPYSWEKVKMGDATSTAPQNGLYKPISDYVSDRSGIPILRIDAFYSGKVTDFSSLKRLNCSSTEIEKYLLFENDIVINRVNSIEYLGKCAHIYDLIEDTVFESNMMRFHMDEDRFNATYVTYLLCSDFIYTQILSHAKKAVNQASINQKDVQDFDIFVPPLDIQNQFAIFVQQVDKLKVEVQKSLDESQILFDSLMQKYFS